MIDIDFFNEHGYYIEPDVFSAAQCDALIAAAAELESARSGKYSPAMMPHRTHDIYLEALRNPALVAAMRKIFASTPAGLQTEYFYCKPGTRGFSLHQDNFYAEAPYGAYASAWCPMTDIYPEKGGLIVYPGSHKEHKLPTRPVAVDKDSGQDPNANNEECIVPPQYKPITPEVPKGAALYIHGSLVHGSNRNATQEWRPVLLMTYLRKGAPFRAGNTAKRSEVELEAA